MKPEQIRTGSSSDGTFFNDKLYVLAHDEILRIYDLNNPNEHLCCSFEAVFERSTKYFLQSKSGVFLIMHGFRARNKKQQPQGVTEFFSSDEKSDEEDDKEEDQEEQSVDVDKQENQEEKSGVEHKLEGDQEEKSDKEDKEEDPEEKSDEEDDKKEDEEEKSGEEDKQENQDWKSIVRKKTLKIYQLLEPEHRLKPMKNTSNMTIFYSDGDAVDNYLAVDTKDWDCLKGDSVYMAFPCKPSKKKEEDEKVVPCYGIFLACLEEVVGDKIIGDLGERPMIWSPAPALWFQPRFA